jgi:hypothetical protein
VLIPRVLAAASYLMHSKTLLLIVVIVISSDMLPLVQFGVSPFVPQEPDPNGWQPIISPLAVIE